MDPRRLASLLEVPSADGVSDDQRLERGLERLPSTAETGDEWLPTLRAVIDSLRFA